LALEIVPNKTARKIATVLAAIISNTNITDGDQTK